MFDKQKVLEKILEEAPVISNLRKEIEVDYLDDKVKVPIYAYYFNRGVKDSELSYDRINNPINTSPNSSLAEIYSFTYWKDSTKEFLKKLEEKGTIKKGEEVYQAPVIEGYFGYEEALRTTREPDCNYKFFNSAYEFKEHFNEIVKKLDYDLELLCFSENGSRFFSDGAYGVKSKRMVNYSIDGKVKENLIRVISLISMDLDKEDPSLSKILDEIENCYNRIKNPDFLEKSIIFV